MNISVNSKNHKKPHLLVNNRIVPSIDKLTLNFKRSHYFFLYNYFHIKSPLQNYNFNNLYKRFLSFKIKNKKELYNEKKLEINPNLKYSYRHLLSFQDTKNRKIIFRYSLPGCPLTSISIDFIPTISQNFSFIEIIEILNSVGLNYRDFTHSTMEVCWDFYGEKYKKILLYPWVNSKKFNFYYNDKSGKGQITKDPSTIPQNYEHTFYIGNKYKTHHIKAYKKEEEGQIFDRIEITIPRRNFRELDINNLDDLFYKKTELLKSIFRSFYFAKFNRKQFSKDFPIKDRVINKLKYYPTKYKVEKLSKILGAIGKFTPFNTKKYLKKLPETQLSHNLFKDFLKHNFFKDIDPLYRKKMDNINEENIIQTTKEINYRENMDGLVKAATKLAKESLTIDPLIPLKKDILTKIGKFLFGESFSYPQPIPQQYKFKQEFDPKFRALYLGRLNGLIRSIQLTETYINKDLKELEEGFMEEIAFTSRDGFIFYNKDFYLIDEIDDTGNN